jgi:hypothetical protein
MFLGNRRSPFSFHKYLYASDDPVNRIDPGGNTDTIQVLTAGAISAGLATLRTYIASSGRASRRDYLVSGAAGFVVGAGLGWAVPWVWSTGNVGRGIVTAGVAITSAIGVDQVVDDIEEGDAALALFDGALTASGVYALHAFSSGVALGKVLGRVIPPDDVRPGTRDFGNRMHALIAEWLQHKFPSVEFRFRIKQGENGVDVEVLGRGSEITGFRYADIKPRNASQQRKLDDQTKRWNLPEQVRPFTYDEDGYIFDGF